MRTRPAALAALAILLSGPLAAEEQRGPDRDGLRRDTWYFVGYQWVVIGMLYVAPESVSGWSDEQKQGYDISYWWDNVTHPQWDSDDFYLNYVVHPYWGAAYYVRARERGYSDEQAFWYSALLSTIYEFGAEALFEEPSYQDLIVTPVGGTLLGRYFMGVREDIVDREIELGYRSRRDQWLWVLTDPLGALNRQVDRLTGRKITAQVRPYYMAAHRHEIVRHGALEARTEPMYGIEIRIQW